jgi:sugar phosphate isomerase/epimerase
MHNHAQYGKEGFSCDPVLAVSPSIMLNFDCGHYYGSTGKHPVDFIKKYKDRIYSIHLKDKTGPTTKPADTNQVWGQGETPLKDVLTLLKTEKWPIYCDIELEYEIKPWSNAVKELGVCVRHAREILL